MAENKKSFLLYCDIIHTINKLSDEQSGILFKHILAYVNDQHPETSDVIIDLVFEPIKQGLKRDLQRYLSICERNKKNGESGGRPKKKPKKPSRLITNPENPHEPKKADSDMDSDNDIEIKIIYNSFYDSELRLSGNDKDYLTFIKYLFGENKESTKMIGVLSIPQQLKFDKFEILKEKAKINKVKLLDILSKIENDKKYYKGKKVLYTTLDNWITGRFIK